MAQKIIKIGSSYGNIIPKNIIDKLGWKVGGFIAIYMNEKNNEVIIRRVNTASKRDEAIAKRTLDFIN